MSWEDFEELGQLHKQVRRAEEKMKLWRKIAMDQDSGLVPILLKAFRGDLDKQDFWLFMKNPSFHDLTPADMIMIGRTSEVVRFLTNVLDDPELFKG